MAAVKEKKAAVKKEVVEQSIISEPVQKEIVSEQKSSSYENDYSNHPKFAKFNNKGSQ